jgi:hypothetical protein
MTWVKHARIMVIIVMGISIATFYNNCSQSRFHAPSVDVPITIQQELMKQDLNGKVDQSICDDPSKYSCVHNVYAQNAEEDHDEINFPCVTLSSNREFCLSGLQYSHKALESREDFSCYLNLSDSFHRRPVSFTAATYKEAIEQTFAACEKVLGN